MGWTEWIKILTGVEQIKASKIIYDEYKYQIDQLKKRVKELESVKTKTITVEELELFIEKEKEYHKQIIELITENRNLKEFIIFSNPKRLDDQKDQ